MGAAALFYLVALGALAALHPSEAGEALAALTLYLALRRR
jgi:hypothetical protein